MSLILFCSWKRRLLIALLPISLHSIGQSEISLYNSKGDAVAYIDVDDENTIYLWSGKPVAYLLSDGTDLHVYGFNGKHLGWHINGIIRDHSGNAVGFVKGAVSNVYLNYESYKGYKQYKPYKNYCDYAPYKPYLTTQFSNTPLSIFLQAGNSNSKTTIQRRIYSSPPPILETDLNLLAQINLQKQQLFDRRTSTVQSLINQTAERISLLANYDSIYSASLYNSLSEFAKKLSSTQIDYSNNNSYNEIINRLNSYTVALDKADIVIRRMNEMSNILTGCRNLVNELIAINPIIKDGVLKDYNSYVLLWNKGYSYFSNQSNFNTYYQALSELKARLNLAIKISKENRYVIWTNKGDVIWTLQEPLDEAIRRHRAKQIK